jgi:hypothetical protein
MTQPGSKGNTHPLPPPEEIVPTLGDILRVLGRNVPTLNWLYSTYPHLRPHDQQITSPSTIAQISEPVPLAQNSANFEEELVSTLRTELDRMDKDDSGSQQLVDIGHPENPGASNSWQVDLTSSVNTRTPVPQPEVKSNEKPESEVEDGPEQSDEQTEQIE